MSAHFNVNEIGFISEDLWLVTASAWRGACIEVFARAEYSVADCLNALETAKIPFGKDGRSPSALTRLRALDACIASNSFGQHGELARTRIADWLHIYETRASMAHGRISVTPKGVTIRHRNFNGREEIRATARHLTRIEMFEVMVDMDRKQRLLHQQLGHIKALAPTAKPITP